MDSDIQLEFRDLYMHMSHQSIHGLHILECQFYIYTRKCYAVRNHGQYSTSLGLPAHEQIIKFDMSGEMYGEIMINEVELER